MAARDSLGSQLAVWVFVAITATSASTWYLGGSHESPKPPGFNLQKADASVRAADNPSIVVPSPILRPLALLATAIGSEPLFVLKSPGTPALSDGFRSTSASDDCAAGAVANPVLLDQGQDVCTIVAAMRRKVGTLKVQMLIATLPDWVDSSLQWTFDPMIDAIQMSAAQMGYVLTGFDMVDTEPDPSAVQPKGSVWPFPRVHEMTPGSLLFRRPTQDASSTEFLLVMLVGETATAGVHSPAFAAALDLAMLWEWPGAPTETGGAASAPAARPIGILGPTYSGSAFSVARGLQEAAERHHIVAGGPRRVEVVTGSATNTDNRQPFDPLGFVSFRAATRSDLEELSAIAHYLGRRNPGWSCGNHMALVVEANTTWGRGVVRDITKNRAACQDCKAGRMLTDGTVLPCAVVVPFPMHISRLRSVPSTAAGADTVPSRSIVPLDLSEKMPPVDRVPPESPQLTAATVEMMMGGMFRTVQDRQITAIGILATDKRDHLYLAEEIARHRPNVLAFTVESSLVYLHPDVAGYVRGTLVASTYSVSERTQRLTRPVLGERLPQQFGSSPAHGVFNALAVLLGHPEQLIDYDIPAGLGGGSSSGAIDSPCRSGADGRRDGGCSPPVWISVVGHKELLPLDAEPAPCDGPGQAHSGYALCAPGPSASLSPPAPANRPGAATPGALAASCTAGVGEDCTGRLPYLAPHDRFLLSVGLLFIGMVSYQVWLQRRVDLYRATGKSSGSSSVRDWLVAARNLVREPGRESKSGHPARAEFIASLAAIRGATITLFLWWTKLALIFLADRFELAAQEMQWVFWAIALMASIYVVWQTVNAFWSIGGGSWRDLGANRLVIALLLALAVVASVGNASDLRLASVSESIMIAFGLILCGLSIFANPSGGGGAASTLARWRRLPALLALGAFIALSMHLMFTNWGPIEALMYADRTASIADFVSPASPILLFVVTLFWWGAWNVRRLQLLNLPEGEVGIGVFLVDRARAAGIDSQLFRQPSLTLGAYIVVPTVAAAVALGFGRRYVGTIDGRYFGEFLLLGAAAIATVMLHALAHAMHLGRALVNLLQALSRHPGAPMFRVLGKEPVAWRITYRESSRPDLETLHLHIARLDSALDSWGRAEARLLPRIRQPKSRLKLRCRSAMLRLRSRGSAPVMDCPLDLEDWRALNRLTRLLHRILQASLWSPNRDRLPVSPSLVRSLGEMEYIVLFHASIVLRDLLMRLVSGFTMVIGGILMLAAAHLLYTFEGRVFWLTFDAAAIVMSAMLAVRLLVIFERNPILSALWGTAPGRISLFGGLTWRAISYAFISIATLFAVAFPELGGQFLNWVMPARAVLSE